MKHLQRHLLVLLLALLPGVASFAGERLGPGVARYAGRRGAPVAPGMRAGPCAGRRSGSEQRGEYAAARAGSVRRVRIRFA